MLKRQCTYSLSTHRVGGHTACVHVLEDLPQQLHRAAKPPTRPADYSCCHPHSHSFAAAPQVPNKLLADPPTQSSLLCSTKGRVRALKENHDEERIEGFSNSGLDKF
eukprot:6020243-Amphidinium_carterae.2